MNSDYQSIDSFIENFIQKNPQGLIPVAVYRDYRNTDIVDFLDQNVGIRGRDWYYPKNGVFLFSDTNKAMLFKLAQA